MSRIGDGDDRFKAEVAAFGKMEKVHNLPLIQSFWSENYLRPKFQALGYANMGDFNLKSYLKAARDSARGGRMTIASIGSGNCDFEIDLATKGKAAGVGDFLFECYDLSDQMLERGRSNAASKGLAKNFKFITQDANNIDFEAGRYNLMIARESLHHIVALESVYQAVLTGLEDKGLFLVLDMVGRNGHMSWPEALTHIETIWGTLSKSKRYHHVLKQTHDEFPNTDFSSVGFEGVRAQDVLPLLLEYFCVQTFLGVQCIVRPFIGRGYGLNYDVSNEADVQFIRFVAELDDRLIDTGVATPINAFATFGKTQVGRQKYYGRRSAQFCARWPD